MNNSARVFTLITNKASSEVTSESPPRIQTGTCQFPSTSSISCIVCDGRLFLNPIEAHGENPIHYFIFVRGELR